MPMEFDMQACVGQAFLPAAGLPAGASFAERPRPFSRACDLVAITNSIN